MAEPEHVLRQKLDAVFARQDFYEAYRRRDSAAMIAILNGGKVTQGQIAARTGLAQSTLSNYKRGVNSAKFASTFETLADGLGMPPHLRQALGMSVDASPDRARPARAAGAVAGLPADTFDLQLLAEAAGRNGTAVKRRDLPPPSTPLPLTLPLTVFLSREVSTLLAGTASDPGDDLRRRLVTAAGESSLLAAGPRPASVTPSRPGTCTTPPSRPPRRPVTRP